MGSRRLEHGPFRDDTLGDIAPKRDKEFASQRHDGDPADASLPSTGASIEPLAQGRTRLMPQPEPGEFYHCMPQAPIAGLGDPLLPIGSATLPGARSQSRISGHLPPVCEAAKQRLKPEE